MGILTLIRHGQANPFEKDSDRLSQTGEAQARAFGDYLIRHGLNFDEVYSGTLVRQRRTAEIAGESFSNAGLEWPQIQSTPDLNEYDADGLINRLVPALAERDENFRGLVAAFEANRTAHDRNRYFQKMFENVATVWLKGDLEVEGVESWEAFRNRVTQAIKRITAGEGAGRRIGVFTSGGVIGLAVQSVLGAPDRKALEINWRVRNCSLTEFIFSRDRMSLDSFNAMPHLHDPSLHTFR